MVLAQIDYNAIIHLLQSRYIGILSAFLFCIALYVLIQILSRKKKLFYNTGFKIIFSAWDKLRFKLRIADFDDTKGIRYIYLLEIKIFGFDFYRLKYIDKKGKIRKRNLRFGGN